MFLVWKGVASAMEFLTIAEEGRDSLHHGLAGNFSPCLTRESFLLCMLLYFHVNVKVVSIYFMLQQWCFSLPLLSLLKSFMKNENIIVI